MVTMFAHFEPQMRSIGPNYFSTCDFYSNVETKLDRIISDQDFAKIKLNWTKSFQTLGPVPDQKS